jgi:hypothetical protein
MKKPRPLSTIGPRAFTCSTLSPLPKQFREESSRTWIAALALLGFLALLAIGLVMR